MSRRPRSDSNNARRNDQRKRARIRDWLLYVLIAILIVAMIAAFAVHEADTGRSRSLPLKWLGFAATTALVFGYALRACRRWWRVRKFWLLLTLFFLAHLGLGVFVLTRIDRVPLSFFAVLNGLEYAALTILLGLFLDSR